MDVTLTCECGTFAIGRCSVCTRPVCGDHSAQHAGKLTCIADITASRAAAQQAEAAREATAERRADDAKTEAFSSKVIEGKDAIERLLIFMVSDYYYKAGFSNSDARTRAVARIRELILQAPGSSLVRVPSEDPAKWTANAQDFLQWLGRRRAPDRRLRRGFKSWYGWMIGTRTGSSGRYGQNSYTYDLVLREDGLVFRPPPGKAKIWPHDAGSPFAEYLGDIAQRLGLV